MELEDSRNVGRGKVTPKPRSQRFGTDRKFLTWTKRNLAL